MEKPITILDLKFFQMKEKLHKRLPPLTEKRLKGLNLWEPIAELELKAQRITETKDPGRIIELNSTLGMWELKVMNSLRQLVKIFAEEGRENEEAVQSREG